MSEATTDFQLDQAIGMQVNRAAFLMTEEISRRFVNKGYALSAQDFGILFRLSRQGAMSQVDIAAVMMRDKTTITRRIDGLVKKGLVVRTLNANDRRSYAVGLTKEGEQALAILIPQVSDFQQELLQDVDEEEQQITLKTLQHISEQLIAYKTAGEPQ